MNSFIDEDITDEMEEDSDLASKLHGTVESAEQLVSSQIKSLEILANICCCGDDDSDEFYEDESCSEESLVGDEGLQETLIDLNPELKKAFLDARLFQLVIEKAKLPAENIVEALFQHRAGWLYYMKSYYTPTVLLN